MGNVKAATMSRSSGLRYRRLLLKLSGEALMGKAAYGIDTTAALRAVEMNCEALAKATQVDGVYSADPKKDPGAVRYDKLTYSEVLARDLKVMDGAAIALARDNKLPVIVFSIEEHGNLLKVLRGEASATVISG